MGTAEAAVAPRLDVDPFSTAFMDDPYPGYARMREQGAAVYSEQYDCWVVARHDECQAVLTDFETYCSSAGVGLSNFRKEKPWRPPSIVLEADPPLHTRTRAVIIRALSPGVVRQLRERFEREAEVLVDRLVARGSFDAVHDLAEYYPIKVFPDAVGLRPDGREHLLPYGSMVFNSFGPQNALTQAAFANADAVRSWIMTNCARNALSKDGLGAMIYAAADTGELTEDEAGMLLRSFLSAGVDTTVHALGNAIWCLATHPGQWAKLRADPALARNAFEESLRFESTAQVFFRTTTREARIGDCAVPANEKVAAFMGAGNRDARRWVDPDDFDIERRVAGHLTFGVGIHGCVGQSVARLEGEAILSALARKAGAIELADAPQRLYNNVLRGFASLPVRVRAA